MYNTTQCHFLVLLYKRGVRFEILPNIDFKRHFDFFIFLFTLILLVFSYFFPFFFGARDFQIKASSVWCSWGKDDRNLKEPTNGLRVVGHYLARCNLSDGLVFFLFFFILFFSSFSILVGLFFIFIFFLFDDCRISKRLSLSRCEQDPNCQWSFSLYIYLYAFTNMRIHLYLYIFIQYIFVCCICGKHERKIKIKKMIILEEKKLGDTLTLRHFASSSTSNLS